MKVPGDLKSAEKMLARVASIDAEIAKIEALRLKRLAAAGALADRQLAPLVKKREGLAAALEPWWASAKDGLVKGKRKSMEIGGCKIGTRSIAEKLVHPYADDDAALAAIADERWRAQVTRTKHSLDRKAMLKLLAGSGATSAMAAARGFGVERGEVFFVGRADSAEAKISAP